LDIRNVKHNERMHAGTIEQYSLEKNILLEKNCLEENLPWYLFDEIYYLIL